MPKKIIVPDDLRYTEEGLWIRVEDNIATVGFTPYFDEEGGFPDFIDLPALGRTCEGGDIGTYATEWTSPIVRSPLTGKIIEVNEELEEDPDIVANDPYGAGWFIRIELPLIPKNQQPHPIDKLLTDKEFIKIKT